MSAKKSHDDHNGKGGGLDGLLGGLSQLMESLSDLAKTGQDLRESSKTWEVSGGTPGREFKGVYGFNVRMGLGDKQPKVEPFGNIRPDKKTGRPVVQEVSEPVVDLFEETDHTLIVAEMPGIAVENVKLEFKEDVLTLSAERGQKKYLKEITLPKTYTREQAQVTCNNGIVEIKCQD
jgi:HSP20 family protein